MTYVCRSIGVRDGCFLLGGGGLKSLARGIFFPHCLHGNQGVLPEYYMFFVGMPENGYLKGKKKSNFDNK